VDGLGVLGTLLIGVLMVIICADIVARNALGASLPLVSELGAMLLVMIVALQLATTVRADRLARTEIFYLPFRERRPRDRGTAVGLLQSGRRHHHRPDCLRFDPHSRQGLVVGRLHRNHRHRDLADMAVSRSDSCRHDDCRSRIHGSDDLRPPSGCDTRGKAMSPIEIGALATLGLLVLIYLGMPIGIGMLTVSFLGVAAIRGDVVSLRMMGQVANDSLREYLFAVVPCLFSWGCWLPYLRWARTRLMSSSNCSDA
jgi:hypothetical protein